MRWVLTRIYVVRHCEAEGNACRRSQTNYEGTVTTKGIAQSEALRIRFHNEKIDAVYSSDSYRARVTADPVAKDHGLLPKYRYLLREYRVGNWDGSANGNVYEDYPDVMKHNAEFPGDMYFPGGDTYGTIECRCRYILNQIVKENPGKTVVLVSHALTIRVLLAIASGLPGTRINEIPYGDNTSVSLIEYDGSRYSVRFMSDNSHLPVEFRRSWNHDGSCDINLAVHTCDFAVDTELIRKWKPSADIEGIRKNYEKNSDSAAVFLLSGKKCGFVALDFDNQLGKDYLFVKDYCLDIPVEVAEYSLQAIGYALHIARKNNILFIAVPEPKTDVEKAVVIRFQFEPVPGFPGYLRLGTLIPPCELPVV